MKPAEQESVHELLPWYVAGTLDAAESASFRAHLEDCSSCRAELAVVGELRGQLERHGRDWVDEHPPAERLVAVVRGEGGADAEAVRRHLELCATCVLEARWIRGEETEASVDWQGDRGARDPVRRFVWIALALAAGLVAGLLLPVGREPIEGLNILVPTLIAAPMRDAPHVQEVRLRPGQKVAVLHFELDFPADAFPLSLELQNERGETVERLDGLSSDVVYQGANLLPSMPARPGRYTARIVSSNPAYPPLVMPFELVPPAESR